MHFLMPTPFKLIMMTIFLAGIYLLLYLLAYCAPVTFLALGSTGDNRTVYSCGNFSKLYETEIAKKILIHLSMDPAHLILLLFVIYWVACGVSAIRVKQLKEK